jgi:hypothetical protein
MRFLLGVALVATAAGTARADEAHADDASAADLKFEEAMKLRDQGKIQEACARFDDSLALNPNAIGTILNVARCAEDAGKTGTAVRWFTEARDRAREQNLKPQMKAAEDHLAKLVDHVPHLAIAFAEPLPPDGKIVVDGRMIDNKQTGDLIVDPSDVKVVVSAPGRVPWETTVRFSPKGDHEHQAIAVPKLGYPMTIKNTRRTVGRVLVGSGVAAVAGGIVIGLVARSKYRNATASGCSDIPGTSLRACDEATLGAANTARTIGNIGTVVGISGLVLVATGATLWWLSPKRDEHAIAIVPTLTPTEAGVAAVGRF